MANRPYLIEYQSSAGGEPEVVGRYATEASARKALSKHEGKGRPGHFTILLRASGPKQAKKREKKLSETDLRVLQIVRAMGAALQHMMTSSRLTASEKRAAAKLVRWGYLWKPKRGTFALTDLGSRRLDAHGRGDPAQWR